jgi:hypothetical protein
MDRAVASQRRARAIAPWLANKSPLELVFLHLLFIAGLWLVSRGAAADTPSSLLLRLLAALIGAAAGLQFGFFEQLASGWWRNDSLFPSFSHEQWWLAKLTAAAAGAYFGVRLPRLGAAIRRAFHRRERPRVSSRSSGHGMAGEAPARPRQGAAPRVQSPGVRPRLPAWGLPGGAVKRVGIAVIIAAVAAGLGVWLTRDPMAFRSEQFLVAGRMPKDWTSREHPGSLGFSVTRAHAHGRSSRSAAWVNGVTVDPERTLDYYRNRPPPKYQVTEVTIDSQPALQVQSEQRVYYVKNLSGELLSIRFEEATPAEEIDEFMSHLRFLPGRKVDPDAQFELSGTVGLLVGNCMPPAKCKPRGVQREIVVRGAGQGLKAGEVVARVLSDEDGDFELELPPGRYHLFALEDGEEWCTSTGPHGPCGVRIIDRDIEASVVIDKASH